MLPTALSAARPAAPREVPDTRNNSMNNSMNHSTEFDYTFTDRELQEILGIIELKASTGEVQESPGLAGLLQAENNLGLQFQPHEMPIGSLGSLPPIFPINMSAGGSLSDTSLFPPEAGIFGCSPNNMVSLPGPGSHAPRQNSNTAPALFSVRDLSLSDNLLSSTTTASVHSNNQSSRAGFMGASQQQQHHQQQQQQQRNSRDSLSPAAAAAAGQFNMNQCFPLQRRSSSNANSVSAMATAGAAALSAALLAAGMQAQGSAGEQMYGMMSPAAVDGGSSGAGQSKGAAQQSQDNRPQVSHSTVEKQRRDRINTLIDELRELVPPQKSQSKNDGLEARRPKHVVLADTIALLKSFHNKLSLDARHVSVGGEISSLQVKDEGVQSDTSKGSASSQPCLNDDRMEAEMQVGGAVGPSGQQPHPQPNQQASTNSSNCNKVYAEIPMSPSQLNGVTVERGKEAIMYVQVKCRDRRGLLSDIINALRMLPLEIRTAAITTTGDGTVRDVFEIMPDDDALQPAEIQNMVHDALYQHHIIGGDLAGKKHKMQETM